MHPNACISLPHACMETCQRHSVTAGQPECMPKSSHSTSLQHAISEGQTLSTSTDHLVPRKLSHLSFLHLIKVKELHYIHYLNSALILLIML